MRGRSFHIMFLFRNNMIRLCFWRGEALCGGVRPCLHREGAGRGWALIVSVWLGREDSNLRMAESKSAALPLGYAPLDRIVSASSF